MKKELDKNYKYCEETIALKDNIEAGFLALAERLYKIRHEELYLPAWEDFDAFCEEMRLNPSTVSKLCNIHTRLVVEMEIPKSTLLSLGGYSDLSEVLVHAKDKKGTIALIEELAPLQRSDRRKLLTEKKTGIEIIDCKHKNYYIIKICKDCGNREKVYED